MRAGRTSAARLGVDCVAVVRLVVAPAVAVLVAGCATSPGVVPAATSAPAVAAARAAGSPAAAAPTVPAASAFDRLKALAGEWIDVDGSVGMKGRVAVTYRVTGAGSAVVETLFPGAGHEMATVYHRDGSDVVLTHYCAAGNQPRMRAKTFAGDAFAFDFDGGTNLDPARDSHMHAGRIEFLGPDRIRSRWIGWDKGGPSGQPVVFELERRKP